MNTFAIIETGGKQFRAEPKQLITMERLKKVDSKKEIAFDKVLAVQKGDSFEVGTPYLEGASVVCEFVEEVKGPKVISFKMRRRKNYRKKIGHRQIFSQLRVKEIHY